MSSSASRDKDMSASHNISFPKCWYSQMAHFLPIVPRARCSVDSSCFTLGKGRRECTKFTSLSNFAISLFWNLQRGAAKTSASQFYYLYCDVPVPINGSLPAYSTSFSHFFPSVLLTPEKIGPFMRVLNEFINLA